MQRDAIEGRLLTCQEIFLQIEQKVSALGLTSDLQQQQLEELGAVGSQLELLKADLLSVQQQLQQRRSQAQRPDRQPERPLAARLQRSSSFQEVFSSPRNKLLRQSSLQQQKELELQLSEQRGLTRALALQGRTARLCSPPPEEPPQALPRPAPSGDPDPWSELHHQFLTLEKNWLLPPSEVADSFSADGGAQRGSEAQTVEELQDLITHLRGLRAAAAESQDSARVLDQGWFRALHRVPSSLSPLAHLLRWTEDEDGRRSVLLQTLSSELDALSSELTCQRSKVSGVSDVQRCLDDAFRVLSVIQASVAFREKQLRDLKQESVQAAQVSSAYLSSSIQASQLQEELEPQPGVCCHGDQVRSGSELQSHLQQLVRGLKDLLALGRERLAAGPEEELRDRARLAQRRSGHMKFLQFLDHRFRVLQYLSQRVPESAPQGWEGALAGLQDEVTQLQQRGLEKVTTMERILEVWSQWDEDSAWTHSLLTTFQTSFPRRHQEEDSEEQISKKLSAYQEICRVLENNRARLGRMLEAGLWLQEAGCSEVGVSTNNLNARWKTLYQTSEQEHSQLEKRWKMRRRFDRDFNALVEWMGGARQVIDTWPPLEKVDVDQVQKLLVQSVDLAKDLEAKSGLMAAVVGAGAQMVQLREEDEGGESPDWAQARLQSRLRQVELDWSRLLAEVPAFRTALTERCAKSSSQQEALQRLQTWMDSAETRLEEVLSQAESGGAEPSRRLKECRDLQAEAGSHQALLDLLDLLDPPRGTESDHRGRCDQNQFAEQQGRLTQRWFRLQAALNRQVQEVQQELRSRAEQEVRLQQISCWISRQNRWIHAARTPSSRAELRRSRAACQALLLEVGQKRDLLRGFSGRTSPDAVPQAQMLVQMCEDLGSQAAAAERELAAAQPLWDHLEAELSRLARKTSRTRQSLALHQPQVCLQAHADLHQQLQRLHQETSSLSSDWDQLGGAVPALGGVLGPAAAGLLAERVDKERDRWSALGEELRRRLQRSRLLLQVWEEHRGRAAAWTRRLRTLQADAAATVGGAPADGAEEQTAARIRQVEELLRTADLLQSDLQEALEASRTLTDLLEPPAASLVQSELRLWSRDLQETSWNLNLELGQLQEELQRLQELSAALASLEEHLRVWQQRLQVQADPQSDLLQPCGLSADLDVLNELSRGVTLGDAAARRLQRLDRCWAAAASQAEETCSELQTEALRQQSFQQKCQSWMSFLQRMEDSLAVDIAASYAGLRQQLCTHKRFQTELSIGHQILHSVIAEALHLLQRGEVDDRSGFILKLAHLREHWQGVVQRADQRRSLVEGLVKHWHAYSRGLKKLQRFLTDTKLLLPPAGPARSSLQQLQRSLQDLQRAELQFQRHQAGFVHTLDLGRQLFAMADQQTQEQLQADLGSLQEDWDKLQNLLGRRTALTQTLIKKWRRCEDRLTDSRTRLEDLKTRLDQSMPESEEAPQSRPHQENEDPLEDWAQSLTELSAMKTDLSQYIIPEDILLLQEQVEHLHCQWEELCLKVSLRKQEVADRLNAWLIFHQKNKELCDWLTQMENKVALSSDLNIEEMVEKLKKDCMEEINLFSENKTHLKQLGEQLISASNRTKETEVNAKLKDVSERWQHLFHHVEARVRKLRETLAAVQQLDKNMSNLRTWLARVEAELAEPPAYQVCHADEIQRKLTEQQELQRDVEQHAEGVAAVLTLCRLLLHDADACGSDAQDDSIQQTTRSLEQRWRNICARSAERGMRIEETWRLWSKFLDDHASFEGWLSGAERTAARPESAQVLYTAAKEELKRFEAFQRQVQERLTQLELLNKRYRRLARENRTDAAGALRQMVQDGNRRWDGLQRRVAAIVRRLRHFASQREEFEAAREGILVWLTEMDLQLTDVEHFSASAVQDKMRQLQGFQQDIGLNADRLDALIVAGEALIQKSAPLDAALIEDELEELHQYCQEVFGRVARFHQRLVSRRPVLEEQSLSDPEESPGTTTWTQARKRRRKREEEEEASSPGQQVVCHLLAPPPEHSGRETPVSVDSIPLEWDHTVDVGGSSHEDDDEDEEATFFSALSDAKVTQSLASLRGATIRAAMAAAVKSASDPPVWRRPVETPVPAELQPQGYGKLMSECSGSLDHVRRVTLILNDHQEPQEPGLGAGAAAQTSTGVIERWELLQAQRLERETDVQRDLQQRQKLNSDLCDVTSWLGRVLPELERLQSFTPATSIRDFKVNIQKLKEMQKTFASYKCLMISINLSGRHFLRGDGAEQAELQDALGSANHSWTQACCSLERWERRLHGALLQCQEFHETLHALLLWLAQAESRLDAVRAAGPATPRSVLMQRRRALMALQEELQGRQQQVTSLQEISSQLLVDAADDGVEAKEKVHVIANRLQLLLRRVDAALQRPLEVDCSQSEAAGTEDGCTPQGPGLQGPGLQGPGLQVSPSREARAGPAPQRSLFSRALRAAFPLQLLFLLLLLLACLLPLSEDDFSCTLANNYARSFYPTLRYTNGPPPT